MTDLLALTERVRNTIQLGESHFREFKSALEGRPDNKVPRLTKKVCEDIGEALVAFANADGGDLLIGVEDDGTITGIPHNEEDTERMLEAYKTHVHPESSLPMAIQTKLQIDRKIVLFFSVTKGTTEIFQLPDGRCVRRQDKSTVPVTVGKLLFERQEVKSREFDRQFVDGAIISDLDVSLVESMADNYLRGISAEKYLQQIGLAEYTPGGLKLRMAALLLFARDIQRWHPRSQVRILKVSGTELQSGEKYNVQFDDVVPGNLWELLRRSWEALRPYLAYKTEFGSDAKFEQLYLYPELACREALVNAIAHRDYTIQNGIDVFIFDDRMEIRSPGLLLSSLSLEDLTQLKGVHESRNSLIAKILRENKFMRELGEGMRRMFELMEEFELSVPVVNSSNNYFSVTLYHKSVYSSKELEWLNLFGKNLTNLQKKIVVLGINGQEISPQDIYTAMNTSDRNIYDREVTFLRISRILEEIRSNASATQLARAHNKPKQSIPRFKVKVPHADKKEETASTNDFGIFVVNLSNNINEMKIREFFTQCGGINKVLLPKDRITRELRGFGFVWFTHEKAMTAALRFDGHILDGRPVRITKYVAPAQNSKTSVYTESTESEGVFRVFVSNISKEFDQDNIKEIFGACGSIIRVDLPKSKYGDTNKGFCFIWFETGEGAEKALEFDGKIINNRVLKVAKYERREKNGML
jgi:ATP-dependent DNA helicase RecG